LSYTRVRLLYAAGLPPSKALFFVRNPYIGLDHALEFEGHGVAVAVTGIARGDPDPAFAHAVFLDVVLFHAVKPDADAPFEQRRIVMRAAGIVGEAVGKSFCHGMHY
jgi:hypothetical protein